MYTRAQTDLSNAHFIQFSRKLLLVSLSLLLLTTLAFAQPLNGSYTINSALVTGGTNFQSFNDAAISLDTNGVSGPVVFNVVPGSGPYLEQVTLDTIVGVSPTNTVTFFGNGNTLQADPDSLSKHVLELHGADHVILDSLVVVSTDTSFGWGIHLWRGANYNTIRKCSINVSAVTATPPGAQQARNSGGIVVMPPADSGQIAEINGEYLTIEHNEIVAGYRGILFFGPTPGPISSGNTIANNTIYDFRSVGMQFSAIDSSFIENNEVFRTPNSFLANCMGILLGEGSKSNRIQRNKIHDPHGGNSSFAGSATGVFIANCDAPVGEENLVVNNLIYDFGGIGPIQGLYSLNSDGVHFLHNTISFDDVNAAGGNSTGVYQLQIATNNVFKNNLISISRGGPGTIYGFNYNYFNVLNHPVSNFNVVNINSAGSGNHFIGRYLTDFATMADWQNNAGLDTNSVAVDPFFANPLAGDYTPANFFADNLGEPLGISEDLNGAPRSLTTPDPGAIEFVAFANNVALTQLLAPTYLCGSANDLVVELFNFGSDTLDSVQVHWTENGGLPDSVSFVGPLAPGASNAFTLASLNIVGPTDLLIWSKLPNGAPDSNPGNDTLQVLGIDAGLAGGTYTINSALATGGSNYQSFSDVASDLNFRGICGPVVFNVVSGSGPYTEQVELKNVQGTSSTNTITFNGNGETLQFTPTSAERYLWRLNGTSHVTLDSLNLVASSSSFGYGIQLLNASDSNTIQNCTIDLSAVAGSNNPDESGGIVVSNSEDQTQLEGYNARHLIVENNEIIGGFYGIQLNGEFPGSGGLEHQIIGNHIRDFHFGGIRMVSTQGTMVSNNDIHRANRTNVHNSFYGIFMDGDCRSVLLNQNRIHNSHDNAISISGFAIGIYAHTEDAPVGQENKVINNLIYGFNGLGNVTGIRNVNTDGWLYYHNTISLDFTGTNSAQTNGFIFTGTQSNIDFRNNIVSITRGGNGAKIGLNLGTNALGLTMDYNSVFISHQGPSVQSFGAYGGQLYDLAGWQAVNSGAFGQNSIEVDPQFVNPAAGDFHPRAVQLDSSGINLNVLSDLDGTLRSTPPDFGALEFLVLPNNAGVSALALSNGICAGTNHPLTVSVTNYGSNTLDSVQVFWQLNGGAIDSSTFYGPLLPGDTAQFVAGLVAIVSSNNVLSWTQQPNANIDSYSGNDTNSLNGISSPMSGTYTINAALATGGTNFQSFANAVDSLETLGICGPVVLNVVPGSGPYNEQVELQTVPGTSSINTVTFEGNGNVLEYAATSSLRYIFRLDSAQHIVVDSLEIKSIGTSYGIGIMLSNGADFNRIQNCRIDLSSITNFVSSAFAKSCGIGATQLPDHARIEGNNTNYSVFENNEIIGGFTGISILGLDSGLNAVGNQILSNTIRDFRFTGIRLSDADSALVSGNDISRPLLTSVDDFLGIQLRKNSHNCRIEKNQIHNSHDGVLNSSTGAYGIYLNNANAPVGEENYVVNNLIYNLNTRNGIVQGISSFSSDGVYFFHNTISLDDTSAISGETYGFEQLDTVSNVEFRNNIVSVTRRSSGNSYCLVVAEWMSDFDSDNNALYVNNLGTGAAHTGRLVAIDYTTLVDWQGALTGSWDNNSVNHLPGFTDLANDDYTPTSMLIADNGSALGVIDDVFGASRSLTTPDPGAIEYLGVFNDVGVVVILEPASQACSSDSQAVKVVVTNFGGTDQSNIPITVNYSGLLTGTMSTVLAGPLAYQNSDTLLMGYLSPFGAGTLFTTAYTSLTGDQNLNNDTVQLNSIIHSSPVLNLGNDTAYCGGNYVPLNPGQGYASYAWSWGTQTSTFENLNPQASATYHLIVTDSNNCSASDSIQITLWAPPLVDLWPSSHHNVCDNDSFLIDPGFGAAHYTFLWSNGSVDSTLWVSAPNTYVVTVTDSNGCSNFDALIIANSQAPTVNLGPDVGHCLGTPLSITLISNQTGAGSYLWSGGATTPSLNVISTGTYTLSYTATNGCSNVDSINVVQFPLPNVDLGPDTEYCDVPIQLNAGFGFSYLWSDSSTGQYLYVSMPGTYWVEITDLNGCVDTDTIVVGICTGVEDVYAGALKLFPNPASQSFFLTNSGPAQQLLLEVFDLSGQKILQQSVFLPNGGKTAFETSSWSQGLYFVKLLGEQKQQTIRLVVE